MKFLNFSIIKIDISFVVELGGVSMGAATVFRKSDHCCKADIEITAPITGTTKDASKNSMLRKTLVTDIDSCLGHLDERQLSALELIFGEAITNAFSHATGHGLVVLRLIVSSRLVGVCLSSPTNGYMGGNFCLPEDIMAECGRGQMIIDGSAASLRETGLKIDYGYKFRRRICGGRTHFEFVISR